MEIPKNISYEDVIKAIELIDQEGYPEENESTKFDLFYNQQHYPPKYVLSLANQYANGEILEVGEFSKGDQTNTFLKKLGFEIVQKDFSQSLLTAFSWNIVNGEIAIKKTDRSVFLHHGTGIPIDIRPFFRVEGIQVGEKVELILKYEDMAFKAHIEMRNPKSPRTRLFWKSDFVDLLSKKYSQITDFYQKGGENISDSPYIKFKKANRGNEYDIQITEKNYSSDYLTQLNLYSRENLKNSFQITDATINNGIFAPKGFDSIWVFITEKKTSDRTPYQDFFDGTTLIFEGQMQGRTDDLLINHQKDGTEILVFYRIRKDEHLNYSFRYLGKFDYLSHKGEKPTQFVLQSLQLAIDEGSGLPIPLENLDSDVDTRTFQEGAEKTRIQTYYERNPKLRDEALKIWGTTCHICGFNFSEKYGSIGEGYIEIHHLKPISSIKRLSDINPKTDLVPVCSNCHRMIHRRKEMMSIEQMKSIFNKS
jgi:5-methylcytosine-specific restriction protein A